VNLRALRAREPTSPRLERFRELATLLTGDPDARAEDGVSTARALVHALGVPGLSRYGMTDADLSPLCAKAKVASSMKANPIELTEDELLEIARLAL
jgi:alcohol dehydrogenase class IV